MDSKRDLLVKQLIKTNTLKSKNIISAFRKVKREDFVPSSVKLDVYGDYMLRIGEGQAIYSPTTVAVMTEALEPKPKHKILEVGAGTGYQTAILSQIVGSKGKVISLEILPFLYEFAKNNLRSFINTELFCADGRRGYPYQAPFDRIIINADIKAIPDQLLRQLKIGGIMVIPIKGKLLKLQKTKENVKSTELGDNLKFIPFVESN